MNKQLLAFLAILITMLGANPASARERRLELVAYVPILTGQVNLYAPETVGSDKLYLGGWRDEGQLEDAIYLSTFDGTSWGTPQEVFSKPGWSVNDPSIVQLKSGKLAMYYTALNPACTPIPDCWFVGNVVGVALSTDGGYTWEDKGIVIPTNNGLDQCGAWSPSARRAGNNVIVVAHGAFGHNGCPFTLYQWTMDSKGKDVIGATTVSTPRFIDNVDVLEDDGGFIMVGNAPDLLSVYRYVSTDGVTFTVPPDNPNDAPLMSSAYWVNTPHITGEPDGFSVWFGWNAGAEPYWYIPEIHRWTFDN